MIKDALKTTGLVVAFLAIAMVILVGASLLGAHLLYLVPGLWGLVLLIGAFILGMGLVVFVSVLGMTFYDRYEERKWPL